LSWREGAKSGPGGTAPSAGKKKGGGSIKVTAAATRFQQRAAVQQKAASAGEGRWRAVGAGGRAPNSQRRAMATRIRASIYPGWEGKISQLAKNAKLDVKLLDHDFS